MDTLSGPTKNNGTDWFIAILLIAVMVGGLIYSYARSNP